MAERKTEYERVADEIRAALLSGDVPAGTPLPQRQMAERFSANAIAVREAFRTLEHEGLITIEPKWGARVIEITDEHVRGMYLVREGLERIAAREAAMRVTPAEGERLLEAAKRCDAAHTIESAATEHERAEAHLAVHDSIVAVTGVAALHDSIRRAHLYSMFVAVARHTRKEPDPERWHERLVKPIILRDPVAAEEAMRLHIAHGLETELRSRRVD